MSNAFWHGFGAVWNRRDGDGRVVQRIPLPTDCCSIRKDLETGRYWYDYNVDGRARGPFPTMSCPSCSSRPTTASGARGLLDLAREAIALDAMTQRYGKKFYQNGARLSGVLEVDTDAKPETRQKLKKEFQAYAADDAFAVAVIDHGMKFTPMGVNQHEAQFIETREFSVEEISRFTGIPKHMLQTGKESYDSNAQQRLNYITDTLLPYVVQWENEDTYKLPRPGDREAGVYIHGNVEALLRADPTTRANFYAEDDSKFCVHSRRVPGQGGEEPHPEGTGKALFGDKKSGLVGVRAERRGRQCLILH